MIHHWVLGNRLGKNLDELNTFAASLAFYFLLTLAPFILTTLSILHILYPQDISDAFIILLNEFFPKETQINLEVIVHKASQLGHGGLFSFQVILALWTTIRFMRELNRSLSFIFQETEKNKGLLKQWLKTLSLFLIWSFTLASAAVLLVNLPLYLSKFSSSENNQLLFILNEIIRYTLIFLVPFLATFLTFRILIQRKHKMKTLMIGSLFSTLGWFLNGWLFTYLVQYLWVNNFLYGAMGSIFLALMWSYFSAWIYFAGAIYVSRTP